MTSPSDEARQHTFRAVYMPMSYERDRADMLERQLIARGVHDTRVLEAFARLPRELFVPEGFRHQAYTDGPLPIGVGQTISQPYVVAQMLQALQLDGHEKVLDVGVGSGYQTALLSLLASWVYGVERQAELLATARALIEGMGFDNVALRRADGSLGWREMAPFDAIVVGAAGPELPAPLLEQLGPGGRLVMPVGESGAQRLLLVKRLADGQLVSEDLGACRFVPLIGRFGFDKGV